MSGTPVYITAEELRQIADFDFSSRPALAVQRDIFVFQCCVGCRIGDLYRMTWSNVEGDVFDYIAGKTKDDNPKTISVPLVTMAKKILKRYESSGRATILPFISEQKYNDAIKEVFRLAEHQYAKLVIAGELLDIFVTTVFPCEIVEIVAIEEV